MIRRTRTLIDRTGGHLRGKACRWGRRSRRGLLANRRHRQPCSSVHLLQDASQRLVVTVNCLVVRPIRSDDLGGQRNADVEGAAWPTIVGDRDLMEHVADVHVEYVALKAATATGRPQAHAWGGGFLGFAVRCRERVLRKVASAPEIKSHGTEVKFRGTHSGTVTAYASYRSYTMSSFAPPSSATASSSLLTPLLSSPPPSPSYPVAPMPAALAV